jgi:DivIVA domain-containing protein
VPTFEPDRFTVTRRGTPGYVKSEVDEFVARIEATLGGWTPADGPVKADDVRNVRFATAWLRPGYDEQEVDQALARYAEQLAAREG